MTSYTEFLETKRLVVPSVGRPVSPTQLHPALFPFQRDLVAWALKKGRCALFCDTGMGKTIMQLEWARHAATRTLILAPLAVARQTVAEGAKWGYTVRYVRHENDVPHSGTVITNYEMLEHFDPTRYGAVVLDESSILKAFEGKTRTRLINAFRETPLRLCCTATPAPNDITEIANHSEFLGALPRTELLAAFFVHDSDTGWRLKGHARAAFYRWLASWGMSIRKPSDIGHSDEGYNLPGLTIQPHFIPTDYVPEDRLFAVGLKGITDRAQVRRGTIAERVAKLLEIINGE